MSFDTPASQNHGTPAWPWRVAVVVETPELIAEISSIIQELNAPCVFRAAPSSSPIDISRLVERERPQLLFVELARTAGPAAEWINVVRAGAELPLVVAVHVDAEPAEMIAALRAGAAEFLYLPVRPAIFDAMDRIATRLEARQSSTVERGRIAGILSAKGGCGATSLACHLPAAMRGAGFTGKMLVADLDHQSPSAHRVFRSAPRNRLSEAFESVRRLNSGSWPDFVTSVAPGIDLLAGVGDATPPEPWRVECLFRFVARQYSWVMVDLGRHLNPVSWAFLQNIEELFIVTAPDVLALFQTRAILQTLAGRGFDRDRVRLILNRNQSSPQDFWVESIRKMFEINILSVIPNDVATMNGLPRDRFEFPANTMFGRAMTKLANRLAKPDGPDAARKVA